MAPSILLATTLAAWALEHLRTTFGIISITVSLCITYPFPFPYQAWRRLTSKTVMGDKVSKAMPLALHAFVGFCLYKLGLSSMTTSKQERFWSWLWMFLHDSVMSWAETNLLQATCIMHWKELDGQARQTVMVYCCSWKNWKMLKLFRKRSTPWRCGPGFAFDIPCKNPRHH